MSTYVDSRNRNGHHLVLLDLEGQVWQLHILRKDLCHQIRQYLWEISMQIGKVAPIGARKCNSDYSNLGKTDQPTDGHKSS